MLFFRKITTKKNGKEYVYVKLIENYRQDGRIKQRVVANLGSLESLSPERIRYLIAGLRKLHHEVESQKNEVNNNVLPLKLLEIRTALAKSRINEAISAIPDLKSKHDLAEALIISSVVNDSVNKPVHEYCREIGLINASSLEFYNCLKNLGQNEIKNQLANARVPTDGNIEVVLIHIIPSVFEGLAFEVDAPANVFIPQKYAKQLYILIACDINSNPIDFEYVEDSKGLKHQLNILSKRLKNKVKCPIVVLDSEQYLGHKSSEYLVAQPVQEVPKEVLNELKKGTAIRSGEIYFNTAKFVQRSEIRVREIRANLAKVSAGLETIKADILTGKLVKESSVRKRAENVIKSNRCEDLVTFNFSEVNRDFKYQIREEALREKIQITVLTNWVVKGSKNIELIKIPQHIQTSGNHLSLITDQLKIPPINMYADYHYSPDIISGNIQLQIIRDQLLKVVMPINHQL